MRRRRVEAIGGSLRRVVEELGRLEVLTTHRRRFELIEGSTTRRRRVKAIG